MPVYTHNFEIIFDDHSFEGEIEFNTDGKTTYRFDDPIVGIEVEEMANLNQLFAQCTQLYKVFGGLDKIEITKKP